MVPSLVLTMHCIILSHLRMFQSNELIHTRHTEKTKNMPNNSMLFYFGALFDTVEGVTGQAFPSVVFFE